jgi:hypothetical protein
MDNLEYLMAMADNIGARMDAGRLPPQDSSGRYLMEDAAASVAAEVGRG